MVGNIIPLIPACKLIFRKCETWMRKYIGDDLKDFDYSHGRAYSEVNKFVSSGASLSGKR